MSTIIVPRSLGQPLNLGFWPTKNLVFYWRGIYAGKVIDESLNRNHGVITGATWAGQGLDFVPGTDQVDIGSPPTMLQWTIIVICTPDATRTGAGEGATLLSNDRSGWNDDILFGLNPETTVINTANRWACNHQEQAGSVRTIVEDTIDIVVGRQYFVAVTADLLNLKLYVDGTLRDTTAKVGTTLTYDGATTLIGKNPTSVLRGFDGIIKDVKIYNRALSASEVQELMLNPNLPMQREPIWLFAPPVVAGLSIPIAMHHYKQMQGAA